MEDKTSFEKEEITLRPAPTNPRVDKAKSHHKATASLPGGDKYTSITKWRRRILAVLGILALIYICYTIALTMNFGGSLLAPDGPSQSTVEADFKKVSPPAYDSLKYLKETTASNPDVKNVKIGRVVTSTGEGSSGYICDASAEVTFSNESITSTSKMRIKYTYNSLLHSWSAGQSEIESSNYHPNSGPDADKIEEDAMTLLEEYDADSAAKMEGASTSREGELGDDGGELTIIFTKPGAGANGGNLVKTMKVRVGWSEVSGWVASVTWLGTTGETLSDDVIKKEKEAQETTMQLAVSSGAYVQLTGNISGNTLTTNAVTRYTIDGIDYVTNQIALTGNTSSLAGQTSGAVNGTLSVVNGVVTLTVS